MVKQHLIYLTAFRYRKGSLQTIIKNPSQSQEQQHKEWGHNISVDIQPYQFYFHVVDKVSGTFIHFAIGKPSKGICGKSKDFGPIFPPHHHNKKLVQPQKNHQKHESEFALQAIQSRFLFRGGVKKVAKFRKISEIGNLPPSVHLGIQMTLLSTKIHDFLDALTCLDFKLSVSQSVS